MKFYRQFNKIRVYSTEFSGILQSFTTFYSHNSPVLDWNLPRQKDWVWKFFPTWHQNFNKGFYKIWRFEWIKVNEMKQKGPFYNKPSKIEEIFNEIFQAV
jgi:hypothetical protein